MLQDRFIKAMLVIIAVLLAANLLRPAGERAPAFLVSSAQAQQPGGVTTATGPPAGVTPIGGYRVSDLKEVVAVGDGQSFVVSNPNGFQVYRVDNGLVTRR